MEWEEKKFVVYMAVSVHHVILKEVEDPSLNTITFLDRHVCINKPYWQSSGIIVFLWKYHIVISDTLIGSFLDVLFLLLVVIFLELHGKPRRKVWVTEKST